MREHLGWTVKGRLPHFDSGETAQFITFRLADSLPPKLATSEAGAELDQGFGACHLSNPPVADLTVSTLRHHAGTRYVLHAFVVMPNHLHVLITQQEGQRLGEIVRSWKGFISHEANRLLGRTGTFWAKDYFDRYIRDDRQFGATVNYIHENPVKSGLVPRAIDWRWSSAKESMSL